MVAPNPTALVVGTAECFKCGRAGRFARLGGTRAVECCEKDRFDALAGYVNAAKPPAKSKPRRSKGPSPTARSLALLRERGWVCEVVERRLPKCFITKDLFGFIDILAIKSGEVLAVQTTSGAHVSDRIDKIANSPLVGAVRDCGWSIHVHGWRKDATGHWVCREENVS